MSAPALNRRRVQQAFDDPSWGTRNNPGCEAKGYGFVGPDVPELSIWITVCDLAYARHAGPDPHVSHKHLRRPKH